MFKLKSIAAIMLSTALTAAYAAPTVKKDASAPEAGSTKQELNVYNWPGYISQDLIKGFEVKYNAKINYKEYDVPTEMFSNLFSKKTTGQDVVILSLDKANRLIKGNLLSPINRSIVSNSKYVDPRIMEKVATSDPYLQYTMPYMWGTIAIGVNEDMVKSALGGELPKNKADLIFNREVTSKLKDCGISYMSTAPDMITMALNELDLPVIKPSDEALAKASELMISNRQNIKGFSQYPTDMLADGKLCVAVGFAGDLSQAQVKAKGKQNISIYSPNKGSILWVDVMAIPNDSPQKDLANKFINYVLDEKVTAKLANDIQYVHANMNAYKETKKELVMNKILNPSSIRKTMVQSSLSAAEERNFAKYFNRVINNE